MSSYDYGYSREEYDTYNRFASNSVRSKGAKTINNVKKGTKRTSKSRRDLKVKRLKKVSSRLLIIVLIVLGLVKGVDFTFDYANRHIVYKNALEDFRPRMVQYLAEVDVDFAISKDKKIVILDNDLESYEKLQDVLSKKVGLSSDESLYVLNEICGENAFDKGAQAMGYSDGKEFLRERYFYGPLSDSCETYLAKYPDMKKFKNNQENSVYEKLVDLQEKDEAKINEYLETKEKGMSR